MKSIRDKSNKSGVDTSGSAASEVKSAAGKYDGMNEEQLMSELVRTVAAEKQNGTFSAATLDEFVSFVSPSLDERSRARLNELVRMIKKD